MGVGWVLDSTREEAVIESISDTTDGVEIYSVAGAVTPIDLTQNIQDSSDRKRARTGNRFE